MTDETPLGRHLLNSLSGPVEAALKAAYDEGFRAGQKAAIDSIIVAATQAAPTATKEVQASLRQAAVPAPRRGHWNASEVRPFAYGAVAGAFRQALREGTQHGYVRKDLVAKAASILGAEPDTVKYRDTFKRLREGGEMLFHNGRYIPGPALTGRDQNENGALNGNATSAPEAGQGANPDLYSPPAAARH